MFARYLEGSLDLFAKQQKQMTETWGDNPFDAMTRMTQRNMRSVVGPAGRVHARGRFRSGGERKSKDDESA